MGASEVFLATLLVVLASLWAVVALTVQVVLAWGGGRPDYSRRAGNPLRAALYNFTAAMTPAHKESVRNHPREFAVGMLMHAGVILAGAGVLLLVIWPEAGEDLLFYGRPLLWLALLANLALLVRRALSPSLRAISSPDDYLASAATAGFLALASLPPWTSQQSVFLIYTALLLVYLPLGKLRHAVFFFLARGDLGARLGHRGVYPPPQAETE